MNLLENVKEGMRSARANFLRSFLTGFIVTLGITCLVGIFTSIDAMEMSIFENLASLGINKFEIDRKEADGRTVEGRKGRTYDPISYAQAKAFKNKLNWSGTRVSIFNFVSGALEVQRGSKKSNPNLWVRGADEEYLYFNARNLSSGRNFTAVESQQGSPVVIIGPEVVKALYESHEEPVGSHLNFLGRKFRVIGVLEEQGGMGGNGSDRMIMIPLAISRALFRNSEPRFRLGIAQAGQELDQKLVDEARGIMRVIRKDRPGQEDSFEIERYDQLEEELGEITGYLQVVGLGFGFITLLGASIGLMNIMLVTVTERTREIGIRKAVGATKGRIMLQFIIEAVVITLLGGIAGIILGVGVGNLVAQSFGLGRFIAPWEWISLGVFVCLVVGTGAGFFPARRASRLDPIESLRYE